MGKYNICMDNMYENALFSEEIFFTQLARIYMINFNSVNTVMLNG